MKGFFNIDKVFFNIFGHVLIKMYDVIKACVSYFLLNFYL